MKLHETASAHTALKSALIEQHASLGDDTEALADTLEGISEFPDLVDWALVKIGEDEALAEAAKELAATYAARAKAATERAGKMRGHLLTAMQAAGETSMKRPAGTISIRAGRPELIVDPDADLPMEFTRVTVSPDKTAIRKALDAGWEVPGARLGNGAPTLSIRR